MKKLAIVLAVPALLLTSCNSNVLSVEEYRDQSIEAVKAIKSIENVYNMYNCNYEGHVVQFDVTQYYNQTENDVPGKAVLGQTTIYNANRVRTSVFYGLPVHIDPSSYYSVSELGLVSGTYQDLKDKLTSTLDPLRAYMRFEQLDDGTYHFYTRKMQNNRLTLYHINTEESITVGGRFNIDAYYNEYGLLTHESIYLSSPADKSKEKTIELDAYYTYSLVL